MSNTDEEQEDKYDDSKTKCAITEANSILKKKLQAAETTEQPDDVVPTIAEPKDGEENLRRRNLRMVMANRLQKHLHANAEKMHLRLVMRNPNPMMVVANLLQKEGQSNAKRLH